MFCSSFERTKLLGLSTCSYVPGFRLSDCRPHHGRSNDMILEQVLLNLRELERIQCSLKDELFPLCNPNFGCTPSHWKMRTLFCIFCSLGWVRCVSRMLLELGRINVIPRETQTVRQWRHQLRDSLIVSKRTIPIFKPQSVCVSTRMIRRRCRSRPIFNQSVFPHHTNRLI
jgi:hypothetical protein